MGKLGFAPYPIGNAERMLFFSLLFILLKLKINFGRVTRGYVLSKKQFCLEISGRFLTAGEEELVEQKLDYF